MCAIHNLTAGADAQPLFRMAIADEGSDLFDLDANQLRFASPRQVVHCLPMYIGKEIVQREVAGRQCPPEVLLSMAVRRVIANALPERPIPKLAAIAVPASYDQFHRRSIKQACRIAGLESVRLVDRSVAAVQSLLLDVEAELIEENEPMDLNAAETILFVGLTGQATEVALIQRDGMQLQQLATAGHWHNGMLTWQSRLVALAAEGFRTQHNYDPTQTTITASRLQMSCERAMNSLLLLPEVAVTVQTDEARCRSRSRGKRGWSDAAI